MRSRGYACGEKGIADGGGAGGSADGGAYTVGGCEEELTDTFKCDKAAAAGHEDEGKRLVAGADTAGTGRCG